MKRFYWELVNSLYSNLSNRVLLMIILELLYTTRALSNPFSIFSSSPPPLSTEPNGSDKQQWAWSFWPRQAITQHSSDYTELLLTWAVGRIPGHRVLRAHHHPQPTCTTDKPQRQHCRNLFLIDCTRACHRSAASDKSPDPVALHSRTCPRPIACPR